MEAFYQQLLHSLVNEDFVSEREQKNLILAINLDLLLRSNDFLLDPMVSD